MKQMPPVSKFMTPMPHTIAFDATILNALQIMSEHRIRHLPVLEGKTLVGVLSDRDVKLASSFSGALGAEALTVGAVMSLDPFAVLPEASLDQVAADMAENKYGCAVVQQPNGKIVGIFTANDALGVLALELGAFFKQPLGDYGVKTHLQSQAI
ncbi:MAG: CBS domain-containing protein [Cryobacterium sp.]|nr:CBS domain-containing protein [Oligoflexia bacterium]